MAVVQNYGLLNVSARKHQDLELVKNEEDLRARNVGISVVEHLPKAKFNP
jgi:hypothetical protein